jgi:hypothetical protein
LPEEIYHQDRWRAVRGYVTDHEGQPVEGTHVQCINLDAILALARRSVSTPEAWQGLVEAETWTDGRGHYEFGTCLSAHACFVTRQRARPQPCRNSSSCRTASARDWT